MFDPLLLSELFDRLRAVARADTRMALFGAAGHQWQVYAAEADEVAAVEAVAGPLPEVWRLWITELAGAGAGPFYGVSELPAEEELAPLALPFSPELPEGEPLTGCLTLSDHGCGYSDLLVLNGPHRGEVWVDFREAGGPVVPWYASVEAWLGAWLTYAEAEWGINYLAGGAADGEPAAPFLAQVDRALAAVVADTSDSILRQYPLPKDKAHQALARRALSRGDLAAAEAEFERAALASEREAEAVRAVGRCALAAAREDFVAWLAAADEGLALPNVYWSQTKFLLTERMNALEALGYIEKIAEAKARLRAHG
jgi:hypothetical protein